MSRVLHTDSFLFYDFLRFFIALRSKCTKNPRVTTIKRDTITVVIIIIYLTNVSN